MTIIVNEDELQIHRAELQEILDSGEPLLTYEIDPPMKLHKSQDGSLDIDCPCLQIGGTTTAGILRIRMTPLAVQSLTRAFEALQTTPDAQVGSEVTRSSH